MASRSGGRAVTARVIGVEDLDAFLRDQIAAENLNMAKKDLRQGTKVIANEVLIPDLKAAGQAFSPLAAVMAETMRTRTDRFVTVRIGAVNPKGLRGFKAGKGPTKAAKSTTSVGKQTSQSYRTTLAFGSDRGPWGPDAKPGKGQRLGRYGMPRNRGGYWVLPTVTSTTTWNNVREAYLQLLERLFREYR